LPVDRAKARRNRRPACAGLLALAGACAGFEAAAAEVAFLPSASLHLEFARYAPSEPQFQWTSWIGGGVTALRWGNTALYGRADVETVVGNERRGFDAHQANYHLEGGVRRPFGRFDVALFFNHVSRHTADRPKPEAVDWNVLGLRASRRFDGRWSTRLEVGAGHTTLASLIGYRFEATGEIETRFSRASPNAPYARVAARAVTTKRSPAFPRDGFVDFVAEAGLGFRRGARALRLYAAYEHRNDVFLVVPGSRDRALLGFRIALNDDDGRDAGAAANAGAKLSPARGWTR
jgi:hypothetical protein